MSDEGELTLLLARLSRGDASAGDALFPLVYEELRQLARQYMAGERRDHTLEATALVNEAYVRLMGRAPIGFQDRRHFFRAAAQAMRRILVDHARTRAAQKRGCGLARIDLTDLALAAPGPPPVDAAAAAESNAADWLALDHALTQLEQLDSRRYEVVMHRYFAGLQVNQVAELLGVDRKTVQRDWDTARAFLLVSMEERQQPPARSADVGRE